VSERNGEIVIEVTPRPGDSSLMPADMFLVAVPAEATVSFERIGGEFETRLIRSDEADLFKLNDLQQGSEQVSDRKPLPRGLYPDSPVEISQPLTYRNTRVVSVRCSFRQLDSETGTARDWTAYRVAIRYPPAPQMRKREASDPFLVDLVVNRDLFPAHSADAPPGNRVGTVTQDALDPHFSLSQNWLKIEIKRRGMYVVTYEDLADLNVGSPNPSTFRMFTGSGFSEVRDLNDPDASWRIGNWMNETAIYLDNQDPDDGTFDPGDRIIFYALGAEDWIDYFDASTPDSVYHVHKRATSNYYYLTWSGSFQGTPLRMNDTPSASGVGAVRTTYRERRYFEKNRIADYDYGGDFWLWLQQDKTSAPLTFVLEKNIDIQDFVPSVAQEFRTVALARYDNKVINTGHHAVYKVIDSDKNERSIGEFIWDSIGSDKRYTNGKPVFLSGAFLSEGFNDVNLYFPKDLNPDDWMSFAWFSLAYERRLNARGAELAFSSPDTTGTVEFRVTGLSASGDIRVFDVTDRFAVEHLTGVGIAGTGVRTASFSSVHSGTRKHFQVVTDGGLSEPASMKKIDSSDLRVAPDPQQPSSGPNMVIVTDPAFKPAAEKLAVHRRNNLPHFESPVIKVVTTEEVYDNFSGGQPDPWAIRNYIKFLYENFKTGDIHDLAFALLLGDATIDFKNNIDTALDRVPTFVYLPPLTVSHIYLYATDEFYAHMDVSDQVLGRSAGDVAIGRLPAVSSSAAVTMVDKIIGYETVAEPSEWRHRMVLIADDPGNGCASFEKDFTDNSEALACCWIPAYVDVEKVYLVDYPTISGSKPSANLALVEMWNEGAIAVNYIGHGSYGQMADERVLDSEDVVRLNNGFRLPVVTAFSCWLGDYASRTNVSMFERLMSRSEGGAVATIAASQLTSAYGNAYLNNALYERIVPPAHGTGVPLGESLAAAKVACQRNSGAQENINWKYNLMGDPALRVVVPRHEVRMIPNTLDSLVTGMRRTVRGGVYDGDAIDTGFNGLVTVKIFEPDKYRNVEQCNLDYYIRGGALFRGTADVQDGEFEINFRVPRYARPGPEAYISVYASDGTVDDAASSTYEAFDLVGPEKADSAGLRIVDGPPRVKFGFKSGLKVVKPGESLHAVIRDQDGINILNTTNEGRHALLIDESPVSLDVTKNFTFDHGGTDTSGVLTYPLPDLSVGNHRAILRVADSFAQTTLDTLEFAVTDPLDYYAEVVFNYPNPFTTSTQFLFQLSDRADVELDIFTVSGRRIRHLEQALDRGQQCVFWDGTDIARDEIANGTYLYVATVDFHDLDRAPLVIRGKLTKMK